MLVIDADNDFEQPNAAGGDEEEEDKVSEAISRRKRGDNGGNEVCRDEITQR